MEHFFNIHHKPKQLSLLAMDSIPIRRKRKSAKHRKPSSSLIGNIARGSPRNQATHGLNPGALIFPTNAATKAMISHWSPPKTARGPTERDFSLELENFLPSATGGAGNNTLVLRAVVPTSSKRFSFNIALPEHDNFNSILFHFNPRQYQKGGTLVLNEKKHGTWGKALNVPLSEMPLIFGKGAPIDISVQIGPAGFDVFVGEQHCARLERRVKMGGDDPDKSKSLVLQFPSTDDRGNREDWILQKVWWGRREPGSVQGNAVDSKVAGANDFKREHPRKLFIRGLDKITSEAHIDLRRSQLERGFRKYGGQHGVKVTVPKNKSFAFVEVQSKEKADLALHEMGPHYLISRAQQSRQEAARQASGQLCW